MEDFVLDLVQDGLQNCVVRNLGASAWCTCRDDIFLARRRDYYPVGRQVGRRWVVQQAVAMELAERAGGLFARDRASPYMCVRCREEVERCLECSLRRRCRMTKIMSPEN